MSLEKAIKHGKEKRKPYQGVRRSSSFDHTCRNHGSCAWCKRNRTISKKRIKALEKLAEEGQKLGLYDDYSNPLIRERSTPDDSSSRDD